MGQKEKTISDDLLLVPFATYSIVTVGLPGLSLAYCFWSAFLFSNPSEINDTDCNVSIISFLNNKSMFISNVNQNRIVCC
jgi:hypothetical protein